MNYIIFKSAELGFFVKDEEGYTVHNFMTHQEAIDFCEYATQSGRNGSYDSSVYGILVIRVNDGLKLSGAFPYQYCVDFMALVEQCKVDWKSHDHWDNGFDFEFFYHSTMYFQDEKDLQDMVQMKDTFLTGGEARLLNDNIDYQAICSALETYQDLVWGEIKMSQPIH